MEGTGTSFRKELVNKLLRLHFKDDKTRVSGDALLLMAELLKVFVVEAAIRSVRQAQAEDLACVDVDQLEKVLPQLTARRLRVPAACSAGDRAQRCGRRACDLWRQAELRKPPPTSKLVCHLQTRCCSLS
ncbi:centromere protein X isoform X2 [Sturnira hondurensis]|uniref:centromere protein X isoform X2 n=1 Tax=Sturnira hondurensis TaxID=192404 RepID=UPI001879E6A0|nr:centromere protein X isoform X2 [Sturnira hondurensis]